jgi:hypothetical protein
MESLSPSDTEPSLLGQSAIRLIPSPAILSFADAQSLDLARHFIEPKFGAQNRCCPDDFSRWRAWSTFWNAETGPRVIDKRTLLTNRPDPVRRFVAGCNSSAALAAKSTLAERGTATHENPHDRAGNNRRKKRVHARAPAAGGGVGFPARLPGTRSEFAVLSLLPPDRRFVCSRPRPLRSAPASLIIAFFPVLSPQVSGR